MGQMESIWPSLAPRVLAFVGAAVSEAVLATAVLHALQASEWELARPVLDTRLAAAAAVMAVGAVWWMVTAIHNLRSLTSRTLIRPSVVAIYAVPLIAWFGVDRFIDGDIRRWAWVGWVAVVLVAHCVVVLNFRSALATLGGLDSHLTAIAVLPALIAVTSVPSVFHQAAVFALPMAAALSAWLLVELWQAMAEWDRSCRPRVVKASSEVLVEDRHHHTVLPRTMVLTSFMLGLSTPAWVVLLERKGHLVWAGRDTVADPVGRRLLVTLFVAMFATYAVGWLWWSAAAAANAASLARWTVSPLLAPFGYLVTVGVVALVPEITLRIAAEQRAAVMAAGGVVIVIAHFGVLRAYRRTAEVIGGELAPWVRVIALPWVALVVSLLLSFFGQMLDEAVFTLVLVSLWVLFYLVDAVSMYQAMAAFDRACTGRHSVHSDTEVLPDFFARRSVPIQAAS